MTAPRDSQCRYKECYNCRHLQRVAVSKGWDDNGLPKPETLKRLGIDKEPSHLV